AGVRAHPLPVASALPGAIARLVALLEAGDDPGDLARTLGDALLAPAVADLAPEVTRLVIIPDGPLYRVPWDALRLADGRRVVDRFAVSIAPSAAVVAALWRRAREAGAAGSAARPLRLLAFGDPAFAAGAAASGAPGGTADVFRSAFDATGGLP